MAGMVDRWGVSGPGPSDYGRPEGQAPYPGMRWDPKLRKWVWPNEATASPLGQQGSPEQVQSALAALKRAGGQ